MANLTAEDALALLRPDSEQKAFEGREADLGSFATTTLRTRGELIFAQPGMWPDPELGGEVKPRVLLTQATPPLSIGDFYIALRDRPTYPDSNIELVCVGSEDPEAVRTASRDEVLVSPAPQLLVPGVFNRGKEHYISAISALLGAINRRVEALPADGFPLDKPGVVAEDDSRLPLTEGVINLRESPGVVELLPTSQVQAG